MINRKRISKRTAGFSLVELMVGMTVLVIATGAVASTLVATNELSATSEEIGSALETISNRMEEMRATEFSDIFSTYNTAPGDDPDGNGSAPGSTFAVRGMDQWPGDASVGLITFPGDGSELREDFVDRELGMPRDLNGDGVIDARNHASDYIILPVRVRVRWTGRSGRVEKSAVGVLANL